MLLRLQIVSMSTLQTLNQIYRKNGSLSKFFHNILVVPITDPTNFRLQFRQICQLEYQRAIDNLDGISNKLLKLIKNQISKPITLMVIQSLKTGIFPRAFKIAKVKPVYKIYN